MSLSEKSSEGKRQTSAPSENTLLAMIAVCFVILHILAITMISATRSGAGAAPEPPGLLSGD